MGTGIVALFGLQAIAFYFRSLLFGVVGQNVVTTLRNRLYGALVRQCIEFFDRERVGDLVSRLSSDTVLIQDAVSVKLSVFIRYGFQVLIGVGLMFYISPRLASTILMTVPALVVVSMVLGRRLRKLSKLQQSELAISSAVAEETLGGIRMVRAYNQENFEINRYARANAQILTAGIKRTKISAFFQSFVSFLMNFAIVLVILYGMTLVNSGKLGLADLAGFLLYGVIVAVSFAFVAGSVGEFIQATGAADRVFELIDLSPVDLSPVDLRTIDLSSGETRLETKSKVSVTSVTFNSITFAYPTRAEVPVLSDLSFSIEAGKVTAVVGPSGAGKSTLVALLLGFYVPTKGELKADGVYYTSLNPAAVRERIAVVPQDAQLFGVTIAENLLYGKPTATLEELRTVAKKANLLEFIDSLPNGFNTNVGERGIQVSGGQRQRLAIARAMLREPDLLILDEATSALDSENEALIQDALKELMRGRTSLIIAHRLSTIKNADTVLVLENGKLVQSGDHETLSNAAGLYKQLVTRQELK